MLTQRSTADVPAQAGAAWLDGLWHRSLAPQIHRWRIGTRLAAMMALAAAVAVALTAWGVRGLGESAESLHRVYQERMKPVRMLSQIAQHMLANQHQLQMALARLPSSGHPSTGRSAAQLDAATAHNAASAIERNVQTIDTLWHAYVERIATNSAEQGLAERFARKRTDYLQLAMAPALAALRNLDAAQTLERAASARQYYERANEDIQALIDLQFDSALAAYETGMLRYQNTRTLALIALPTAMLALGLLGLWQIRSITHPLRAVIAVFHRMAQGRLDSAIAVPGRDEASTLLNELQTLQYRLADNERAIHRLAYYDVLTDLPNRRLLRERIEDALQTRTAPLAHATWACRWSPRAWRPSPSTRPFMHSNAPAFRATCFPGPCPWPNLTTGSTPAFPLPRETNHEPLQNLHPGRRSGPVAVCADDFCRRSGAVGHRPIQPGAANAACRAHGLHGRNRQNPGPAHPATSFVGGLSGHAGRGDHSHQYGHGRDKHRLHHLDMEVL